MTARAAWLPFAAAIALCAAFGLWFAGQQLHFLAADASYPPRVLMVQTASLVALFAFVPFAWAHAYALRRAPSTWAPWLAWLALAPLLTVFAGIPLRQAMRLALAAFILLGLYYYLRHASRAADKHWLALAVVLIVQLVFNGYFSPLNLENTPFHLPGPFNPETAVQGMLFKAFIWIKQFSLSAISYSYWLIAPYSAIGFQAPGFQAMTLLADSPSADITAFYRLLHWVYFLCCIAGSFGFYLLLFAGLRLCWTLSLAGGMLYIFAQEPFFTGMVVYGTMVAITLQAAFPLALCIMICALRANSLFLALTAGITLSSTFVFLPLHPEILFMMLLFFGILALAASFSIAQTNWKNRILLFGASGVCFLLTSVYYMGPFMLAQIRGLVYVRGHTEDMHKGLFQGMRLDISNASLIDLLIGVFAFLSIARISRGWKELLLPLTALVLAFLLAPLHSPLLVLIANTTHLDLEFFSMYYWRRGYFIAFCTLLLVLYAMERRDFLSSVSLDLKRRFGPDWANPRYAGILVLLAACTVCMLLQMRPYNYDPRHCRYYIALETLLANYPLLQGDAANTRLIRERLNAFDDDLRASGETSAPYQQLLGETHIHFTAELSDAASAYVFARKAAPLIDRFYMEEKRGCIHPGTGKFTLGATHFMFPNLAALYVNLSQPFFRIMSLTYDTHLPAIAPDGETGRIFNGFGNGLFGHNASGQYDSRFMVGPTLLHALYLLPGANFDSLGSYSKTNTNWYLSPDLLLNPLYRKLFDIAGIDIFQTARNRAGDLSAVPDLTMMPETGTAIASLHEIVALRNLRSYGMAYLANHVTYIDPAIVAATEPILRRHLTRHDSPEAFDRARDFLYAQLNGLKGYRDILLEKPVKNEAEVTPAGSVTIRNILGEATVMRADCKRVQCVLVYNLAYQGGWRSYSDGQPLEISRANLAFMAVSLPKGSHEVWFVYAPLSAFLFDLISLLTWCLLPYLYRRNV